MGVSGTNLMVMLPEAVAKKWNFTETGNANYSFAAK